MATDYNYLGVVTTVADLPASAKDGDCYLVATTGIAYAWDESYKRIAAGRATGYWQLISSMDSIQPGTVGTAPIVTRGFHTG
jgi:hypothetical protein